MSGPIFVDEEFRALIPPLSNEEKQQLESNIAADGCRDPITIWKGKNLIIDGHNRFEICTRLGIEFDVLEKDLETRDDAIAWMIRNQFGRRNLNNYIRTTLALKLESIFADRAKQNQVAGGGDRRPGLQISANPIDTVDTRKEVSRIASVSHDTVARVKQIELLASDEDKDLLKSGTESINNIYKKVQRIEKENRVFQAIAAGVDAEFEAKTKGTDNQPIAGGNSFFSLDRLSGQRIGFDDWYLVDTWKQVEDKIDLFINEGTSKGRFNEQDGDSIEWARWSWNPVTGCEHGCPYCYARDIANRFYDQKFTPSIWPNRINIPRSMKVPESSQLDVSYKNVFTCSMADLFGRWVPVKWIELVMESARKSPQWNFLFLTKFPQRIHELGELPQNAWMGTSVDCQSRVKNAEKAFEKIGGGTKWLSIEPMLTPLKFSRLDLFDWVVIGGASESAQTPKWIPPMDWLVDLHKQARDAGCKIYYKSNLFLPDDLRIKEFPWVQSVERPLPEHLKYVGIK